MESSTRPIIFLHIPKACGTTLMKLLERWFARETIYSIGTRRRNEVLEELVTRRQTGFPATHLVAGHAAFGLHEALGEPANYITVLRDPVERLLSHFHYARRNPRHPLHGELASGAMGIRELAERRANLQTRYLGGTLEAEPDAQTLENARENLRTHFVLAGLAERFDETVLLLHRIFGRRLFPFVNENVGSPAGAVASLDARTLREVRRLHELDYALYDFVRARFDEQVAAQDSAEFKRRLASLRAWNLTATIGMRAWKRVTERNGVTK